MTLQELLNNQPREPGSSVPDWMLGCFRRHCISFANGESDTTTLVFWFQSCNFTIDLRLPDMNRRVPVQPLADCSPEELQTLANYEGWFAHSDWNGEHMAWHSETSLQLHNRWPEPAQLRRIGNCMIEFAPSGAYVEDWRLQPSSPGPLVGLRLLEERNRTTGQVLHRGGGLIICGDFAALVRGRPKPVPQDAVSLPGAVAGAQPTDLTNLLAFETSVARGSLDLGYIVQHSTVAVRVGQPLLPIHDADWQRDGDQVLCTMKRQGDVIELRFDIDVLRAEHDFAQTTAAAAERWFAREAGTLTRYTQPLTRLDRFKPLDVSGFSIPTVWQGQQVLLLPASPRWAATDLVAVQSSQPALRHLFSPDDDWPPADLTLAEDTADLAWHADEFAAGRSFAYHLFAPNRQRCLGCLYIYPTASRAHDAEAYLWVRSDQEPASAAQITEEVVAWVQSHWPFKALAWPGRTLAFAEWQTYEAPNYYTEFRFSSPIAPRKPTPRVPAAEAVAPGVPSAPTTQAYRRGNAS